MTNMAGFNARREARCMALEDKIIEALSHGRMMDSKELSDAIGQPPSVTVMLLRDMKKRGVLHSMAAKNRMYFLPRSGWRG